MNDSQVDIAGGPQVPMAEWIKYKYVVHIDGFTCSSKLWQELSLGSLVFKEESGYYGYFDRLLVPFKHYVPWFRHYPQELLDSVQWARENDELAQFIAKAGREVAKKYLSIEGLRCYWVLLLREYGKKVRYTIGKGALQDHMARDGIIPLADWIKDARARWPGGFFDRELR